MLFVVALAAIVGVLPSSPAAAGTVSDDLVGDGGNAEWEGSGNSTCRTFDAANGYDDDDTAPDMVNVCDAELLDDGSDAYDWAHIFRVDGAYFEASDGQIATSSDTLTAGPVSMSGLDVTVEYFAVGSRPTLRVFATFENPTGAAIDTTVDWTSNFGSDDSTVVIDTSSGDTTVATEDRWVVTSDDDSDDDPSDPALAHVAFGPGDVRETPTVVRESVFVSSDEDGYAAEFEISVPAGEARHLMFFAEMDDLNSGAVDAAEDFDTNPALDSDLMAGVSESESHDILNWDYEPEAQPTTTTSTTTTTVPAAEPEEAGGYLVLDRVGGIFSFGDARYRGSLPALRSTGLPAGASDATSLGVDPDGSGYLILDEVGGVFTFGDAAFHGSVPGLRRAGFDIPIVSNVAIERTPGGDGYWVLDEDGGVFSFGRARFHGSVPALASAGTTVGRSPGVTLASTPSGDGYWVLDERGGVFAFGDARFFGSLPALQAAGLLSGDVAAIDLVPTPTGRGYWVLDDAGGVFAFGDADFFGSLPSLRLMGLSIPRVAVEAIAATPQGDGYLVLDRPGGVFTFGEAPFFGSVPGLGIDTRAVDVGLVND